MKSNSMKPAGFEQMALLFEAHTKGMPLNIRVQDAAALTSMSVSKLNLLRLTGGGPRFLRFGRCVRYKLAEVMNWMDRPDFASTSEADASIFSASIGKRGKAGAEAAVSGKSGSDFLHVVPITNVNGGNTSALNRKTLGEEGDNAYRVGPSGQHQSVKG